MPSVTVVTYLDNGDVVDTVVITPAMPRDDLKAINDIRMVANTILAMRWNSQIDESEGRPYHTAENVATGLTLHVSTCTPTLFNL